MPARNWTVARGQVVATRKYDQEKPNTIALSPMNGGPLKMSNGLTRLETRFLATPDLVEER